MWPPGGAQGGPKHPRNNLRLNKEPTLRPNNLKNKTHLIFLRPDSNSVAKNKVADQFSALYSLPLSKYKRLKLEKITNMHFRSSEALKSMIRSKLWEAITQKPYGVWIYFFAGVRFGHGTTFSPSFKKIYFGHHARLVDLTWNDPNIDAPIIGPFRFCDSIASRGQNSVKMWQKGKRKRWHRHNTVHLTDSWGGPTVAEYLRFWLCRPIKVFIR